MVCVFLSRKGDIYSGVAERRLKADDPVATMTQYAMIVSGRVNTAISGLGGDHERWFA
jgi:hypothetical protein